MNAVEDRTAGAGFVSSMKRVPALQGGPRMSPVLHCNAKSRRIAEITTLREGAERVDLPSGDAPHAHLRMEEGVGIDTHSPLKKRSLKNDLD